METENAAPLENVVNQSVTERDKLNDHIAALTKDIAALTQDLKYVAADYENYRKRVERERETTRAMALRSAIEGFLAPIDNFGIALKHSENHKEFVEGMIMIYEQFMQTIDQLGVALIDPKGGLFNAEQHMALAQVASDQPEGTVLEVVKKGYRVGNVIIKPAHVKVAKAEDAKVNV